MMALIVGGVVLLIVVGGLAVYRMSQKASLTPTTSNQPASSPSSEVQTAPVVANKTYSSANDAQMDKDLEDTDTSLSALDKDLLSASNTLNDQSGSLTE
jgi:flagellar basal body-associated protein FliL